VCNLFQSDIRTTRQPHANNYDEWRDVLNETRLKRAYTHQTRLKMRKKKFGNLYETVLFYRVGSILTLVMRCTRAVIQKCDSVIINRQNTIAVRWLANITILYVPYSLYTPYVYTAVYNIIIIIILWTNHIFSHV